MKITLHGAADGVTGSAYHVQTEAASVLVDFGFFQGGTQMRLRNEVPVGVDPRRLDAVLLTHGHLDHSGRLPLLCQAGYAGPIYATSATLELAGLILRDSAKVQAHDLERTNRKRLRAGEEPLGPLYTASDVDRTLGGFKSVAYDQPFEAAAGVSARWVEAGHMLGSASIELTVQEAGRKRVVVFSGDLGPSGFPVLRDSVPFTFADLVFLETTYGDRDHRSLTETLAEAREIILRTVTRRGKILVPSFAIGRVQQLLYHLAAMFRDGALEPFPIFVDSPMAIEATAIYARHPELYDTEAAELYHRNQLVRDLRTVKACATVEDSKAINNVPGPCLILAGAGMCNAGRILHHLKQNLWRPENSVILVGFQAEGTLGRQLVEGAKFVQIFGETIAVKAEIHTLNGFSAHAGQSELLKWLGVVAPSRPQVALVHGEPKVREIFAGKIRELYGLQPLLPGLHETIEL
jgi:metallo-beta-lactamase family protein